MSYNHSYPSTICSICKEPVNISPENFTSEGKPAHPDCME